MASSQRTGSTPVHRRSGAPSRRTRRLSLAVLVRVDEHATALRLRPLGRYLARMQAGKGPGDDLGELARLPVRVAPLDRHEHVEAV